MKTIELSIDHYPDSKYSRIEGVATRMFMDKVKQGLFGRVVDCEKYGRTRSEPRANGQVRSYYSFGYRTA